MSSGDSASPLDANQSEERTLRFEVSERQHQLGGLKELLRAFKQSANQFTEDIDELIRFSALCDTIGELSEHSSASLVCPVEEKAAVANQAEEQEEEEL